MVTIRMDGPKGFSGCLGVDGIMVNYIHAPLFRPSRGFLPADRT